MRAWNAEEPVPPGKGRSRTIEPGSGGAPSGTGRPSVAWVAALVLVLVSGGCDSATEPRDEPPVSGLVTYHLESPNDVEGGLLFSVPAAQVLGIQEDDVLLKSVFHQSGGLLYVAVVHYFGTEDLRFQLEVADRDAPPELELLSVVGPDNRQRSLSGYALGPVS